VFEQLESEGQADKVGGLGYLNQLAQYVPSAANIAALSKLLCDPI
jgi:replicative DNA helicase